jgi:gamma-glutamyltranspeptidase/glutathione hydrolase
MRRAQRQGGVRGVSGFLALEDGNPNRLTPGGKVRHTSNPYIVTRDGQLYILSGNTGADTQVQVQVQQFMGVVEFGLTAQEAISRQRFISTSWPATTHPYEVHNELRMEDGFPGNTVRELRNRGHTVQTGTGLFGNGAMIIITNEGKEADVGAEQRNQTSKGHIIQPEEL